MAQTIGIELEACFSDWDHRAEIMEEYPRWECVGDGSLSGTAWEMRLRRPINISDIEEVANELEEICTRYNAKGSVENEAEFSGSWDRNESNGFDTGLHIHFGMPNNYSATNIMSLLKAVGNSQGEIDRLAFRHDNGWARDVSHHFRALGQYDSLNDDRYMGVNMTNIGNSHKNTIEFRWGHASVGFSANDFMAYFNFLNGLWQKHMMGKPKKVVAVKYQDEVVMVEEIRKVSASRFLVNFIRNGRVETKLLRTC